MKINLWKYYRHCSLSPLFSRWLSYLRIKDRYWKWYYRFPIVATGLILLHLMGYFDLPYIRCRVLVRIVKVWGGYIDRRIMGGSCICEIGSSPKDLWPRFGWVSDNQLPTFLIFGLKLTFKKIVSLCNLIDLLVFLFSVLTSSN